MATDSLEDRLYQGLCGVLAEHVDEITSEGKDSQGLVGCSPMIGAVARVVGDICLMNESGLDLDHTIEAFVEIVKSKVPN